jgi:protein-S-isoprenylcysteine O-methyltransferase Ste14
MPISPMADGPTDRPNTIHWPPILYAVALAVAGGLHYLVPIPALIARPLCTMIGVPLMIVGLGIGVAALVRFRADGTPFDPTAAANALATTGIYRFTRNPMYLGAILAFTGLGLWLKTSWLVALMPVLAIALHMLAIQREEAYLERRFGAAYRTYRDRVRRWI